LGKPLVGPALGFLERTLGVWVVQQFHSLPIFSSEPVANLHSQARILGFRNRDGQR
jgi:hypothetical protein